MQNHGNQVVSLVFDAGAGNNSLLQSGNGITSLDITGTGNQTLLNYGSSIDLFRIVTGSGNDSLVSTGSQIRNSVIQMGAGTNSVLFVERSLQIFSLWVVLARFLCDSIDAITQPGRGGGWSRWTRHICHGRLLRKQSRSAVALGMIA